MKIYLATWMQEVSQGKSLTNVSGNRRLLSYYLIEAGQKINSFLEYMQKGFVVK
jgi:hypothetical protein